MLAKLSLAVLLAFSTSAFAYIPSPECDPCIVNNYIPSPECDPCIVHNYIPSPECDPCIVNN